MKMVFPFMLNHESLLRSTEARHGLFHDRMPCAKNRFPLFRGMVFTLSHALCEKPVPTFSRHGLYLIACLYAKNRCPLFRGMLYLKYRRFIMNTSR